MQDLEELQSSLTSLQTVDPYLTLNKNTSKSITAHKNSIECVSITLDKKFLISSSCDRSIRIWNFESLIEEFSLLGHTDYVYSVKVDSRSSQIISGSKDSTIRFWNFHTRREEACIEAHKKGVKSVNFSPDEKLIVSAGADKTIRIWNSLEKIQITCMEGHTATVNSACFSPDGNLIASGSDDRSVRIWHVRKKELEVCMLGHENNVNEVDFSQDFKYIASASDDRSVRLWSVDKRKEEALFAGHGSNVMTVNFTQNSKFLASGDLAYVIIIWNVIEKCEEICLYGHTSGVDTVRFSYDSSVLVSGGADKTIRIWDLTEKHEEICFSEHYKDVFSACISNDSKFVVSGSDDKTVRIWNLLENKEEICLTGHTARVCSVVFSPDQTLIASGSSDKTIKIWDLAEKKEIICLKGHEYSVHSVHFSPDGKFLISGSDDTKIKLWSVTEQIEIGSFEGHSAPVHCVKFNSTGEQIISASEDNTIRIWEISSQKELKKFENGSRLYSVDFSLNGIFAVSCSDDNMVKLWNLAESRMEICFEGHKSRIWSVSFSRNGRFLVSGSSDKTIRIWNVAEKREEICLLGHTSLISSVMFSQDGRFIVSGSWDKTVRIWEISAENDLESILNKEGTQKIFPDQGQGSESLIDSLANPRFQNIISYANAISMIIQNDYGKLSNWNIFIGSQSYTPLHFAAISGETETITQALKQSKHFKILADNYGNSPLYYSIAKQHQATTDTLLKCIVLIGQTKGINEKIECINAIRNELCLIITNSSQYLCEFLSVLLQSREIRPEFAAIDKNRIKLLNSINSSFSDFSVTASSPIKEPLRIKVSMLELPAGFGNTESFDLLKAFLMTSEKEIYSSQMVTSFIRYKWTRLSPYIYAYTLALWLNLVLIIVSFSTDYRVFIVCNSILIIVNFALVLWEIFQWAAEKKMFLRQIWNLIDLARSVITFAWIIYRLEGGANESFDWVTILINIIRGITGFRAFSMTRYYIQLIIQSIIKIIPFLLIFVYTTLAFGLLNNVGLKYSDITFASLWIDSFGLVFGDPGNMASSEINLIYATYLVAAILNVIIMLNMIIALLGDSFDEFQILAKYYDNREMIKVILEVEQIFSLFYMRKEKKFLHICENFYSEEEDMWQGKVVDMRLLIKNSIEESNKITGEVKQQIEELGKSIRNQIFFKEKVSNGGDVNSEELMDSEGRVNECLMKSEKRVFEGLGEIEKRMNENMSKREKFMYEAMQNVGERISQKIVKDVKEVEGDTGEGERMVKNKIQNHEDFDERLKSIEDTVGFKLSELNQRIDTVETGFSAKLDKILELLSK